MVADDNRDAAESLATLFDVTGQYVDKREAKNTPDGVKRKAKVAAHREIEVLLHSLTSAVKWGYIDRHPF